MSCLKHADEFASLFKLLKITKQAPDRHSIVCFLSHRLILHQQRLRTFHPDGWMQMDAKFPPDKDSTNQVLEKQHKIK